MRGAWRSALYSSRSRLDIVAGLVDGILNALTLTANRLLRSNGSVDIDLIVKVALATGLTTVFVFFVAHYAEQRAELARAERELSFTTRGRLATSRLGRRALQAAAAGAIIAAFCGVVGATTALLICMYLPGPRWLALIAVLALLGILGALLARSFQGSIALWSLGLMVGGALLTWVGMKLNIVA